MATTQEIPKSPSAALTGRDPRFISSKQTASLLSISEGTLRQWRCAGIGPIYFKLGHAVRYSAFDIEAYVAAAKKIPSVRAKAERRFNGAA